MSVRRGYTTTDIIYIAVITAVSAVMFAYTGFIYQMAVAAFGPVGSGLTLWWWYWSGPLCYYFRKKPGMNFIVQFLGTVAQVFLGNPAGIYSIGWGVGKGVAQEVGFAASRYRVFRPWLWFIAGMLGSLGDAMWSIYLFGWTDAQLYPYWIGQLPGTFIAGVGTVLLGWTLAVAIEKSGLIKPVPAPS